MSSTLRNKIALVVFLALVVLGLAALIWYLSVGKSWNVAAATIDDATGQMDGYIAILYEGTLPVEVVEEDAEEEKQQDLPTQKETNVDSNASGNERSQPLLPGALSNNSSLPLGSTQGKLVADEPLSIGEVATAYEEKNASVFELEIGENDLYNDGLIVRKGSQRFGVLNVAVMDSVVAVQEKVDYFLEHKVDFVLVVVPDKSIVSNVEGIDVVVSTKDTSLATLGAMVNGTFCVNTPTVGSIGVTLVSPHNVVSSKIVSSS